MERKQHPDTFERYDGWQKQMAKKAAPKKRKVVNGRLFCVKHAQGKWQDWTPYKRPLSTTEASRRLNAPA